MGIFDSKTTEQIKYLEEERVKLWDRLTALEESNKDLKKELKTKTPEPLREAKENSKKSAEYRNKTEKRFEEASTIVSQLNSELKKVTKTKEEINEKNLDANQQLLSIDEAKSNLDDLEVEYKKKIDTLNSKIGSIDEILLKYPELDEKLTEIDEFISKVEENHDKSGVTLTSINKRKKEIDDLHREVFGYEDEDESGETINVDGLKAELEKSYENLADKISESEEEVETLSSKYSNSYSEFEKTFKVKYKSVVDEIEQLLPNALTAGLSAAFSKKKEDEVTSSEKLQRRFSYGIYFLIAVSLLPVGLSVYFLYQGLTLEDVIEKLPRLVLAIVPMYIPILWFTYSANKKLNLSKRLIEEYAHKEVLSRTYEGLAKQIKSIEDKDQSEELRFRLLSNFLQVSAENPGKLISNYEASDHPVMEALEQSYKFQLAIDKLEGVPGLNKVAAILEKNARKKIQKKHETIERALAEDSVEKENGEVDEE